MRFSTILSALSVMVAGASAAPSRNWQPTGGWNSLDYGTFNWDNIPFDNVDWTQVDWNKISFASFPWNRLTSGNYGWWQWQSAFKSFTSFQNVLATPSQVVNGTAPALVTFTGGLRGAKGVFQYGLLSDQNVICWNIAVTGFQGQYQSLARTATHIHQAGVGNNGPPRIVFPNPVLVNVANPLGKRVSVGCQKGPFTTGILRSGVDTGFGFTVRQIERNPTNFFTDIHSSLAVPGAARGQFS
ncbi:hypothetical protein BKA67DRAFT_663640 [Truncatella angustata]|uniref:CHRD domain-containing protein n=1 Tax=Truncatella angustata TaxID=152316 RepID=A0A9P8RN88_9PEZI|nr:uncharacterized protein BKA67DRAFT_663640 [Truncatella angustata]KAH6647308.1 hypothetical protein BKA67DRAFT_663640 [Truncatella angustata]